MIVFLNEKISHSRMAYKQVFHRTLNYDPTTAQLREVDSVFFVYPFLFIYFSISR